MRIRPYADADADRLVEILRMNVPRYFAAGDEESFRQYLRERNWAKHFVYLSDDLPSPAFGRGARGEGQIVGCASCYLKPPTTVGLAWMFFEPGQVGRAAIRPLLDEYLSFVARELRLPPSATLILSTIPRIARFLRRYGFVVRETVKDGYGPGYDKVAMEATTKDGLV
jgi:[ribosomal protein S18]-alanine N-acetyltransferase